MWNLYILYTLISVTVPENNMVHETNSGYIFKTEKQCMDILRATGALKMTNALNKQLNNFDLKIGEVFDFGCAQDPATITSKPRNNDS